MRFSLSAPQVGSQAWLGGESTCERLTLAHRAGRGGLWHVSQQEFRGSGMQAGTCSCGDTEATGVSGSGPGMAFAARAQKQIPLTESADGRKGGNQGGSCVERRLEAATQGRQHDHEACSCRSFFALGSEGANCLYMIMIGADSADRRRRLMFQSTGSL